MMRVMQTRAVVMAGGHGTRMRGGGVTVPKPLVPVAGVPLLERNVCALLHHGFRDLAVVVPARFPEVEAFALGRLSGIALAAGAALDVVVEGDSLGNAGGAAPAAANASEALVVFADNLTAIDLSAIVEHHRREHAALTLAVHEIGIPIAYGVIDLDGTQVVGYREKPNLPVHVSSGVAVLGREAVDEAARGPCGFVDLFHRVSARGLHVAAFPHQALWVDVNEPVGVTLAESMLAAHPQFAALGVRPT
jgi:NDP-sugar pyrophosphorylase family protein